jgi:hypothetical protein
MATMHKDARLAIKNIERVAAIQQAFSKAGVVFLDPGDIRDGRPGVRMKR